MVFFCLIWSANLHIIIIHAFFELNKKETGVRLYCLILHYPQRECPLGFMKTSVYQKKTYRYWIPSFHTLNIDVLSDRISAVFRYLNDVKFLFETGLSQRKVKNKIQIFEFHNFFNIYTRFYRKSMSNNIKINLFSTYYLVLNGENAKNVLQFLINLVNIKDHFNVIIV